MTDDLIAFLCARLDEDEQVARAVPIDPRAGTGNVHLHLAYAEGEPGVLEPTLPILPQRMPTLPPPCHKSFAQLLYDEATRTA